MNRKKEAIIICALLIALPVIAFWAKRTFVERWFATPAHARQSFTMSLILTPHYLQKDEQWKDETVGGTGERLARVGCTVCCLAMALDHYGVQISPKELNNFLKYNDGYTRQGWLKWGAVTELSNGKVDVAYVGPPDFERINAALTNYDPVIVKVYINGQVSHWVILVGRNETDYLVRDPLDNTRTLKRLSNYGGEIFAMRVLKRVRPTAQVSR